MIALFPYKYIQLIYKIKCVDIIYRNNEIFFLSDQNNDDIHRIAMKRIGIFEKNEKCIRLKINCHSYGIL